MSIELIQGSLFSDKRGEISFFNTFDLTQIVRMYQIKPADTQTIRAWQGHKIEQKWFYCLRGSFVVNLLPLSEFTGDPVGYSPQIYTLDSDLQLILRIPGGYVNGFRALEADSELLVFSDATLRASKADDFRFDLNDRPFIEPK